MNGRHRDEGLAWVPEEWLTVELKQPAGVQPRPRHDWLVTVLQALVVIAALIQVTFIALIWSGDPTPAEGAMWSAVFGSWVPISAAMWLVLQRSRRD